MEYSYDSNSNRVSQTIEGVTTSGIVYDEQDRLLNFGNKSFNYNANGELISVSTSSPETVSNYVYDVFGNLKSVTLPSKAITYGVDASNRRMVKKIDGIVTNYFIWNKNNQLIGLSDANGTLTHRFVYGSKAHSPDYMIKGQNKFQIISNYLGSPVLVVNATTGSVAQKVVYDEFGRVLSDTAPGFTPFGFAGCLYDVDTKLCRFGARDYDASIGRWLSKDPIMFNGGDTNLYGYVLQDPINLIDPEGTNPLAIGGIVAWILYDLFSDPFGNDGSIPGRRNDRRIDMFIPGNEKYERMEYNRNIRKGLERFEDKNNFPANSCDLT